MNLQIIKNWVLKLATRVVNCNVFVCYSSENLRQALKIKELVDYYGGVPFLAPYSIEGGKNPKEVITSNIKNCRLFIPLISSKTTKSTFAHQEIGYALSLKKDIIPVIIGKIRQKDLGFLYDHQYEMYNTKPFRSTIKRKILTTYAKVISVYVIILIFLLWNRFGEK